MADEMKCFDCGFINEGENFCLNCGVDLKSERKKYSLKSDNLFLKGKDVWDAGNKKEKNNSETINVNISEGDYSNILQNRQISKNRVGESLKSDSSSCRAYEKVREVRKDIIIDKNKDAVGTRETNDVDYHVLHTPPLLMFIRILSGISFVTLFVILALSLITIPVSIISLNYVQGGTISERLVMYLIFISILITLAALGAIGNKFNSKINIHNLIEGLSIQILIVILALCLIIICGSFMSFIYAINSSAIIGFSVFLILIFGGIGFYIFLFILKKSFQR